jgi:hypothetical protein
LEIASRARLTDRFWVISEDCADILLAAARESNSRLLSAPLSAAELSERLARNAELGSEAEEWVVSFERARLSSHPLVSQIRRISEQFVNAGYDIASFSGLDSLQLNLFIEVKSHGEDHRFFWSANEIAVAKVLGELYCLYLVDRSKMSMQDYEPRVIRGPYTAFFEEGTGDWNYAPTGYEFRLSA